MNQKTTVLKPIKKVNEPPKLTPVESDIIGRGLYIENWQFEMLFVNKCVRIGHRILAWEKQGGSDEEMCVDVCIYGIEAKYPSVKYPIISSFFIHFNHKYRVYQRREIEQAIYLVDLLQKEYVREKYEQKIRKEKEKLKVA